MANKKNKDSGIEREYTIPLRGKIKVASRFKKTPKAIKSIKEFLARHMRVENRDLNKVKIDKYLNQFMWARGIKNPPAKIKVKVTRDGENIRVELVDYPDKLKFNKAREEKQGKTVKEAIESKKSMMQKVKENMQKPKDENNDGIEDSKENKIKEQTSAENTEKLEK